MAKARMKRCQIQGTLGLVGFRDVEQITEFQSDMLVMIKAINHEDGEQIESVRLPTSNRQKEFKDETRNNKWRSTEIDCCISLIQGWHKNGSSTIAVFSSISRYSIYPKWA